MELVVHQLGVALGGRPGAEVAKRLCVPAIQVADRWHLMENASAAFLGAIRRNMRDIRRALGQGSIDKATLTAAERIQYDGWRRRIESDAIVLKLHAENRPLNEIARRTGRSRKLVRGIVRGERTDTFRPRGNSLAPSFDRLDAEWQDGCRNGAELWRRLRAAGFEGSLRVVTEWTTRRRRDDIAEAPRKCPAPRTLARLMTLARDKLTTAEAVMRPLSDFPRSFQDEVASWKLSMLAPDLMDEDAPARPLRPVTVEHRELGFRLFASALVEAQHLPIEAVTGIDVLVCPDNFKIALELIHRRRGKTQSLHNLARSMRLVARHHCRLPQTDIDRLERICQRLHVDGRGRLTPKNRERLGQFDDPQNVRHLLQISKKELALALRQNNPIRVAKGVERALAMSLLIHTGLRQRTLRTLRLGYFRCTGGGECHLYVPPEDMKTNQPHELVLGEEAARLLKLFIKQHRARLPGSEGEYLFPGADGGPRSKNAMYEATAATFTRLSMLVGLKVMMKAMAPQCDWIWLQRFCNRVQMTSRPLRDKRARMRPTGEIVVAALHELERLMHQPLTIKTAIAYRDALMLALLAARPLRVKNFTPLELGRDLRMIEGGWLIDIPAAETKTRDPISFELPI
jgi:hypothetical protein